MEKKLVAVVAAVLVLAGCSAAPADETTTQRSAPESTGTVAPAETSAPEEVIEAPPYTDAEALYLEWVNSETVEMLTPGKTDQEMVAAGWAACDQLAQGIDWGDVEVIDADADNGADAEIANMASQSLCTAYDLTKVG